MQFVEAVMREMQKRLESLPRNAQQRCAVRRREATLPVICFGCGGRRTRGRERRGRIQESAELFIEFIQVLYRCRIEGRDGHLEG